MVYTIKYTSNIVPIEYCKLLISIKVHIISPLQQVMKLLPLVHV